MRFLIAPFFAICCLNCAIGQEENPFGDILNRPTTIDILDTDDKLTILLKRSYNATHAEIRSRYNYWLQGIGELSALLDAIDRFHSLRIETAPKRNARRSSEQKLAFAEEIERQCATSKVRFEAIREINQRAATAYRISVELELERLRMGTGQPE